MEESQKYETNTDEFDVIQRKINNITEKCILINSGEVFKEFVDCYRKGYFE